MIARPRRRWVAIGVVGVLLVLGAVIAVVAGRAPTVTVRQQFVAGTPEAGTPVELDTSLYLPRHTPAPAVLLAHGLGGTKASVDGQARALARDGFVVLAYTARGFGRSGGLIHLDSLDYEVPDAARLLDFLQARPEVLKRSGKPVLGVAGASYGGALALMLGATDPRISAVAADITWHDLTASLFPQGVYKKLWAGYLFAISMQAPTRTAEAADPVPQTGQLGCGRFAAELCAFYRTAGQTGALPPAGRELLDRSSPASVLDRMRAPTLLTQGEQDSLFPLSEADANARQIAAAGAPVQVRWRSGGHDAAGADDSAVAGWQRAFLEQQLDGRVDHGSTGKFLLDNRGAAISATTGRRVNTTLEADGGYPGVGSGARTATFELSGPTQPISAPAGGAPAAVSSLPGLGSALGTASDLGVAGTAGLSTLPGQTAIFSTAPLAQQRLIAGSSTVRLRVSAAAGTPRDAELFVSLRDVAPDGTANLPSGLVTAVRVPLGGAAGGVSATVQLPWVVDTVPSGHRLAVYVSTTDFGYAMPTDARSYAVSLDSADLTVPALTTRTIRSGNLIWWPITAAIVVLACVVFALVSFARFRGRRVSGPAPELADVPVAVVGLVKEYADGYRAVDDISFEVRRGQVLGLLGPNGAGKTTTLRVLMGLIMPTAGTVRIFGTEVLPGAPVLASVGAFVEGPGLLPHLTGRDNLRLYWAASGRPESAAEFDTVLEIAGLGASLDRRVKTYSHGMQQRLAIAQAMLGLPPVLVLDEPTNGLDPPQIAEMREVLHRYAATGRTVIISSHLLAEVEQTCSHVVVMARGRVVAAGSVTDVAGLGAEQLVVDDPVAAEAALHQAGIAARRVPARRALEEVFLDLVGERDV